MKTYPAESKTWEAIDKDLRATGPEESGNATVVSKSHNHELFQRFAGSKLLFSTADKTPRVWFPFNRTAVDLQTSPENGRIYCRLMKS